MTIREQIDRILAARKEKGKELEARLEAWKKLKESLYRGTSSLVMESMDIKDDKLREQYGRIFNDVDASEVELLKLMDQVVAAMGDGVKRFNRDYISIATVGKERQGKSQFLQSLGDLDDHPRIRRDQLHRRHLHHLQRRRDAEGQRARHYNLPPALGAPGHSQAVHNGNRPGIPE